MQRPNIKPRYEVEQLSGTVEQTQFERDIDNGVNVEKTVQVDAGFMVYFPQGHSIRVASKEELARLGFDNPAELIDDEGDVVGSTAPMTLKKHVQRTASSSRKSATASVEANQGD